MRPPLDGRILITGASSGIGRELARLLAARARSLLLTARREDRLQALAQELRGRYQTVRVDVFACDLGAPGAPDELARVAEAGGPVDVLINNAGFGDLGLFERTSWEKVQQLLQLNVVALTRLCYLLLPSMLKRQRGGILNVSSGVGLTFLPAAAVYGGSKHYVTAFTESLRLELRSTGIVVSQLCPGPVGSEFLDVAGNPLGESWPHFVEITPEQCARGALRGFARGKALIVPGLIAKILIGLGRVSPRWLLRLVYSGVGRWLRKRALPPAATPPTLGP